MTIFIRGTSFIVPGWMSELISLRIGNVLEDICTEGWGDETFLGSKFEKKISMISGLKWEMHYPHSHVPRQKARVGRAVKYLSPFHREGIYRFLVSGLCCSELAPLIILSCRKSWQGKYIAFSKPFSEKWARDWA